MPRHARIAFPDLPHHVMQRGHRRNAMFFSEYDRRDYLATLQECRELLGLKVYETLWEGRFRCSPIETDRYLLACGRYIDQNPVRARLVSRIGDYRWSSYRARAG